MGQTPLSDKEKEMIENDRVDLNEYFTPPTPEQLTRLLQGESPDEVFKKEENEEEVEIDFTVEDENIPF